MNHQTHSDDSHRSDGRMFANQYARLAAMTGLAFVAMYILMYAMVNTIDNALMNVNQVYMAGLMAAPMILIELWLMSSMYPHKRLNALLAGGAVLGVLACFVMIREQIAVGDRQFLRSMIPHHASAILMCEEAAIRSADIERLCQGIISSQQAEIDEMKALLNR